MTVSNSIVKKAKSALRGASSVLFETVNRGLAIFQGGFMEKVCPHCETKKEIPSSQSWCNDCKRDWKRRNPEKVHKSKRDWKTRNKDNVRKHELLWKTRHPEKIRAKQIIGNRVYRGTMMKKPCEKCGTTIEIHAHHPDYRFPTNVIWLCRHHHEELHRELKNALSL